PASPPNSFPQECRRLSFHPAASHSATSSQPERASPPAQSPPAPPNQPRATAPAHPTAAVGAARSQNNKFPWTALSARNARFAHVPRSAPPPETRSPRERPPQPPP